MRLKHPWGRRGRLLSAATRGHVLARHRYPLFGLRHFSEKFRPEKLRGKALRIEPGNLETGFERPAILVDPLINAGNGGGEPAHVPAERVPFGFERRGFAVH